MTPILPTKAEIEVELIRRLGLHEFIKHAWNILHPPEKPFVDNWHVGCIAEHVQALYEGDIQRLLINIPPRAMKTLTTSIFAPAWAWTRFPAMKFIFASYAGELSMDAAGKTKDVLMSSWFQERWGHVMQLSDTQNTKANFETKQNGAYLATSVGGLTAGKGADIITCDDLLKPKEAESLPLRTESSRFFWESLPSRFDNRSTGRMIVVAQRLHPQDVPGEILERERMGQGQRWEKLILPLEYHPTTYMTCLGFKDPRTQEGEPLDKVRFPTEEIIRLKDELGAYAYSAQMDQAPVPREGGMIKESWFRNRFSDELLPRNLHNKRGLVCVVESADCASKAKQRSDPTVWGTWGIFAIKIEGKDNKPPTTELHAELWNVERKKAEFPEALRRFKNRAEVWDQDDELIEDKDAGQQIIQWLQSDSEYKIRITKIDTEGLDKATRMSSETATIERGEVWLPESAPWLGDYLSELCLFTGNDGGGHDDQVDMTSQFLKWFRRKFRKKKIVGPDGIAVGSSPHDISSYRTGSNNDGVANDGW